MNSEITRKWLSNAIQQATTSSSVYQTSGQFPAIDPGLVVEGIGPVKFPLKPATVKKLKSTGQVAPYGQGTRTLVDPDVRNTIELDPSQFQLSDEWKQTITQLTHKIGDDLGLNGKLLEAHLYKLLIYEKGGHFLPHRDSEKLDRMVASLIVVLPNPFSGGELEVRHGGRSRRFDFYDLRTHGTPKYIAFYADCEHEVKRVRNGVRLCLAYNLVLNKPKETATVSKGDNPLVHALRDWAAVKPTEPLIFALEHQYTPAGLSQDLLKGADRTLAELVLEAAQATDSVATFAQLERRDSFSAYDENEEYHSRYYYDEENEDDDDAGDANPDSQYVIQDLIEQEFFADEWTAPDGTKQPWGSLSLDISAVVGAMPVEDWVPTKEEYEGYTGNAGNTLDRWYHRTALIVWPRANHFEILAQTGWHATLPMFHAMMKELPSSLATESNEAQRDCISFARGIISGWPVRWASRADYHDSDKLCNRFPQHLLTLADRELIARFLARINLCDELTRLDLLVVGACQQFGWNSFAKELAAFFQSRKPSQYAERREVALRDAQWLLALARVGREEPAKVQQVGRLCELAMELFLKQHISEWSLAEKSGPLPHEQAVPVLLQSLLLANKHDLAARLIEHVQSSPKVFRMETCQVPALVLLAPWCENEFPKVPEVISNWLTTIRNQLEAATATPPQAPTDWRRPSEIHCKCETCAKLKTFLADPQQEHYQLRVAESVRKHVDEQIRRDRLDMVTKLHKLGSPYLLMLSKTNGSHTRAVKRYELDMELLNRLLQFPK